MSEESFGEPRQAMMNGEVGGRDTKRGCRLEIA